MFAGKGAKNIKQDPVVGMVANAFRYQTLGK